MRLDFFGTILTFVVAILSVGTRFTISPAQTGLILSYVLQVQMVSRPLPGLVMISSNPHTFRQLSIPSPLDGSFVNWLKLKMI